MSDQTTRRRDRKNLGGVVGIDRAVPASVAAARTNVINIERLLVALLSSEVTRLREEESLLRMYMSHLFDAVIGPQEREEFITNFMSRPPEVVLGYPRTSTQFPCFAIVLQSDQETDNFIGDFGGETEDDEESEDYLEYNAAICNNSYGLYVYAEHPDVCLYLYYIAKMIVFGAREFLLANGLTEVRVSGGEVSPDEQYLPDNMFLRVLTIEGKSIFSVPNFAIADRRRLRVLGLYRDDVVVDGVRGGVSTFEGSDGEDQED